ncbi:SpoIIE family protein phosphatase [Pseudoalteromonas phenolica]|uniref:SpoIIE family protein phosphatase n=1 Tax=Pseudoalteromonas phenolica TaxID=161398 RepID=UPI00110B4A6C|nr:SpoIIE family protein phosphatase [Pseudoalteromonas phenolica]TMO56737.1 hypothetical protein CWC21_06080 [Pseudoalteromonas phenolica]
MSTLFYRRFNLVWPAIHSVREIIHHYLKQMKISNDDIDNTGLVLTEYLSNLIRHSEGEDGVMTLVIDNINGGVSLTIIDNTQFFEELAKSDKTQREEVINDGVLREGGMGLALINHYFPSYHYFKKGEQNHFCLTLYSSSDRTKVVLIEDELATLKLIENYLSEAYDVYAFDCEYKAQSFLSKHEVDLLLIDLNLNQMIATKFIEQINRYQHLSNIGIIVMSIDSAIETIKETVSVGIDDYVVKPLKKESILLICERVLRRKQDAGRRTCNSSDNDSIQLDESYSINTFGSALNTRSGDFVLSYTHKDSNDHFLFMVDVMGHGEAAASTANELKGFIFGLVKNTTDFSKLINDLNDAVVNGICINKDKIFTLLAFKLSHNKIEYINIGQPSFILIDKYSGEIKLFDNTQPIIGLNSSYSYQPDRIELPSPFYLLCFTDGLHENMDKFATADEFILDKLQRLDVQSIEFPTQLWQKCLPELTKEIDDSTLLVLNKA